MTSRRTLWPDSLRGRLTGLLFAGLIITVTVSMGVFQLDFFHGKGWSEAFRNLHRVVIVASIMDRVSSKERPGLLPALRNSGVAVTWEPNARPPPLRQDSTSLHLARDLRVLDSIHGLEHVETGYPLSAQTENGWIKPSPTDAWIELTDRSWLRFVLASDGIGALWTFRLLVSAGLLIAGIAALGIWAARRLTEPLCRFAIAAKRLGANVDAPPMDKQGPSEIRQAARAFNGMQDRIRRLVEDRTLMLAAISHDLRTALTRLRFRSEFIADPGQRQKAAADLDELQAMLNATLLFARDDAAQEPSIRLDLATLLQSLCDNLQDAGQAVSYEGPLHLTYDGRPISLRRALANVIDNALTYGQEASVRLAECGQSIDITVADRGPGIPEEFRDQVFAPYFRPEPSRSRDTGGVGLGLAVARAVVRRHGGDITLEDRPGGGLLVRLALPLPSGR